MRERKKSGIRQQKDESDAGYAEHIPCPRPRAFVFACLADQLADGILRGVMPHMALAYDIAERTDMFSETMPRIADELDDGNAEQKKEKDEQCLR